MSLRGVYDEAEGAPQACNPLKFIKLKDSFTANWRFGMTYFLIFADVYLNNKIQFTNLQIAKPAPFFHPGLKKSFATGDTH